VNAKPMPPGAEDYACDYCGEFQLTQDQLDEQMRRSRFALCTRCKRSPGRKRIAAKVRRTLWTGGDGPIRDFRPEDS